MGPVGWQEMLVIGILALVLFGPKKLPELARNLGKAMAEFKRAKDELKSTFDHHMRELERESESLKQTTAEVTREIQSGYDFNDNHYSSYDSNYYDSAHHESEPYNAADTSHPSPVGEAAPQAAESPNETVPHVPGTVAHSAPAPVASENGHHAPAEEHRA